MGILLFGNGCVNRIGDFTVISTQNVEIGTKYVKIDLPKVRTK